MTQSTSFAQMANNQSISLSSALRANTPPTKGQTTSRKFLTLSIFFLLSFFTTNAWGGTWTWTATSGDFGTSPGSETGTVTLNEKSWNYSRDIAGYLGWLNSSIQFGSKSAPENVTLSTSAFSSYTITSISVKASSYNGAHKLTIKVGDATVKSATTLPEPTSSPNAISTGTISKKGDIGLEFSNKSRALYIQSITVTYEDAAPSCTVTPTVGTTLQSVTATENSINATIPISSIGGCNITENGLVYSTTNSTPTVEGIGCSKVTTTACGSTAANKTVTITGLNCGTSYYIRGYATNEAGTSYTNVTTQSTSDCPTYTVTLVPGSGSVADTELEEESGGAGVTLPTATGCGDWTFAGWATASVTETTTAPTLLAAGNNYKPTSNTTLYAVYQRTEETPGTPTVTTTTDQLTRATTDIANNAGYGTWSGKKSNSPAVYAGQSAGGNDAIQLRTTNSNSGIITTTSGGKAKKVTVVWNSNTADNRTLDIYGKNSAYTAATDLYGDNSGTLLGSIVKGTSTELTINGDYAYIGLRSANNAMYLTSISIEWATTSGGGSTTTTYYHSTPDCGPTCTDPALAYATATITKTVGDAAFINSLTNSNGVDVEYTSTNTNVATVDNVGQVTIKAVGETTIKATWDGNTDYCADEASYTLTVNPKTYTVTFNANGHGTEPTAQNVEENKKATEPTAPSATGYTFGGWYTNQACSDDKKFDFNTPITKDITLYAKWTINTYTLTWDVNGGNDLTGEYTSGTVAYGTDITKPADPTRDGYKFIGWHNGTEIVTPATTMPANDLTYTAQWKATYTVTFLNHGEEVEKVTVEAGNPMTLPTEELTSCDTENYPDFFGWTETPIAGVGTEAPADLITAGFTPERSMTLHAVFVDQLPQEGGWQVVTSTSELVAGKIYTIGSYGSPTTGTAMGTQNTNNRGTTSWTTGTPVELTLGGSTGAWTLYDAAYDNGVGGYLYAASSSKNYLKTQSSLTNDGKWAITFNNKKANIVAQGNNTRNIIRYNSDNSIFSCYESGQGDIQLLTKAIGTQPTAYITSCCETPVPTNGSYTSPSGTSVTLTWDGESTRYHITGNGLDDYTDDESYTVTGLTECEEYTFYVSAHPAEGCESAAIQISAQPFSGAKTVTFVYGNEQPNTTFTTDCDNQYTALPNPTRSGYRFLGWFTEESGGTEITENPYTPTADIPLYAQWVQVFTVTYDANNATSGTVPTDANSPYDINKIVTVQGNTGNLQRLGYNFVGWNTAIDASGTQYSEGQTFTITENTTLYAQWIENYCTLTFTIPSGGGQAVSAPEQVLNGYPITFPEVTGISSEYWCETFIGWTIEEPNGEGLWDGTPTIYDSGTNSEAITANTTFYAVYQRSGGGASGSVQLTNTKIATRGYNDDESSITEEDGSVWGIKCYVGNSLGSLFMQLKDGSYYIKTPTVAGNITSLTINYTAVSSDSRTIYFNTEASKDGAVTHQFNAPSVDPSSGDHDYTWDVSAANTKTGYILASSTFKINSIKLDYGPAPIISHSLQCGCAIDEFDLTYDANETNFPNSTTNCEGVTGYKFSEHEDKYTICSSVPTLDGYKFIGWTTNANGSGDLYTSGQEIKCVPSSDITLYAQYERVYTVIFDNQNTINATTQTESGAAVDVPTATEPCGSEWQFVGWSTEEIAPMSLKPTITIEPGTNTYIPEGNVTLYAIYQKTSLSKEFVAGKTGAYKISNGSDKYASSFYNGRLNSADNLAEATTYYITYTASDDGKYTIQQADGLYIAYSGESTSLEKSEEPYYWKITKDGELWQVATIPAGRYLKYSTEFRAYTDEGNIGLIATEGQYYYRTMSCDDNFDITFNNQNGAIIHWQNGYPQAAYQDLEGGTTITTFPMASYEGWTFIGWRAQEYEESTSAPESSSVYGGLDGISGNALTITADVTMYPVFTQFLDNDPFDEVNGGDYYMYYIADGDIDTSVDEYGAANRIYAGEYNDYSFRSTQSCADATLFTFAKLPNGKWTIYDNTRDKFVYGVNNDNKLEDKAQTADGKIKYVKEWTIEVNKGNQVNAVSVDGYILSALTQDAKSGTFKNYDDDNLTNGNGYQYHRVYLGSCTERVFTTAPSTEPIITLNGDVKVTSTATQSVKAASVLTVSASNIATSNLSITSDNAAFIVSPTTITVVDKKVGVTPITITYNPTITSDGTETATITVSDGNEASESITVTGRHLPENFVIAAKWGDNWYAMPANMNSQSSTEGLLIEVDDAANPTKALAAPNTTKYGVKSVYTSNSSDDRFENYGERLVFVENVTEATPVANKTLYNGGGSGTSNTNIQVYAQYANYYSENPNRYEWIPTTTDLTDYTLTSAHQFTKDDATLENARTVSLDNHGNFGTLLQDKSYNGMVRLLPVDNFYGPAELQVVEWKQNSVSVMYTGAGTKYTTKVGDNAESSVQALSSIDHAVYSLATTDLTTATNQPLVITIKDDVEETIGVIKLTIPAIVAVDKTTTALGVTDANAKATSIVVLSNATLTASTTKYTYDDVVVYPGGKLVIGNSGKLGMYTLTLRLGSSWGAAVYEYKYPQFVLNTTTDGAYSNTSGQINLDYVTTKDQYYTFVAPFEVKTKDIKYPIDIYGTNVATNNSGSFEFEYYDGAARAAGNTGWTTVAEDPTNGANLEAGKGYTFLGMPKKVSVNGATSTRQKYGIHRIPMKVAASVAQTHETTDQEVPLAVTLAEKDNDSGWNIVGNPYMSNVKGLTNNDIQVGELVHTDDANGNWTGKWHWDNPTTGQRFLVIPSNDGRSYTSVQVSNATLQAFKHFFVQIHNKDANAMSIPVANRVDKNLAPARYAQAEIEKDIEIAVQMTGDKLNDQMDFLINDIYSTAFEKNADFTKMMNATNFNIYGVHVDNNLSFVALDKAAAMQSVAIGFQVPKAGEYQLSLSDKPYVMADKIEALFVTDHEASPEVTTNLVDEDYTFYVNQAETNNTRFTVSIILKPDKENTPTGVDNINTKANQPIKFLYQDKIYILRNGMIYDTTGKQVITINK